eukprot:11346824-Ditylum_brightwellii.AAC.1
MHNKQRCRIAHDGFCNAMHVADMDKAISKGHLMVEINSTKTTNPLPCSIDEYNNMRRESKFSSIPFVALQKDLLDSTTTSLEAMWTSILDTLDILPLMQEKFGFEKNKALKLFAKVPQMANDIACLAAEKNK